MARTLTDADLLEWISDMAAQMSQLSKDRHPQLASILTAAALTADIARRTDSRAPYAPAGPARELASIQR